MGGVSAGSSIESSQQFIHSDLIQPRVSFYTQDRGVTMVTEILGDVWLADLIAMILNIQSLVVFWLSDRGRGLVG